ncbi:hypothetical protein AY601_0591 [Pedobacter cryoconitis]|uniref:Uncharacterized protein n=1 Tax=Pedobacter cryoconitis TaxID=188932 RepID=A0A127V898_9SPHI|nr:hypothetical protein [Pedobacter cryoconitis]AMP97543.1 hypothetical protein AY601_0591 [Pedobacter cryoconitis]
METLIKLSARSLEYYINAKRWNADLEFYKDEIDFLNKLLKEKFSHLTNTKRSIVVIHLIDKLAEVVNEKHQVKELLDNQLKDLELLAEDLLIENKETIAGKQAHLEYLIRDLVNEYREIKKSIFVLLDQILTEDRLIVN